MEEKALYEKSLISSGKTCDIIMLWSNEIDKREYVNFNILLSHMTNVSNDFMDNGYIEDATKVENAIVELKEGMIDGEKIHLCIIGNMMLLNELSIKYTTKYQNLLLNVKN